MRPRFTVSPKHLVVATVISFSSGVTAAELADVLVAFQTGRYASCIRDARDAIQGGQRGEDWPLIKIRAELTTGRYEEAKQTLEQALEANRSSVRLRWLGRDVYRLNDLPAKADQCLDEIDRLIRRLAWRYRDAGNLVALGQYFLSMKADPKEVLGKIYDQAKTNNPKYVDAYLASGELALQKHDYQLAADSFQQALKLNPELADAHFGLARAFAPNHSEKSSLELQFTLKHNPRHVDALLFLADRHIDSENYDEAEDLLDQVDEINAQHPTAWAYRAVLAHLANRPEEEVACRQKALSWWRTNPEIDHLIGRKLSQKYRFAEAAGYQRTALELEPGFTPAKLQLSQDLLRLGEEALGWQLADEVYGEDNYNVFAHNLVTLHDSLTKYDSLETEDFVVRMDPHEAKLYGQLVLDLLRTAKLKLCDKYAIEIQTPVIVEIFSRQEDFAIRTFGLPGGAGFLGVCFGRVITANSPATLGDDPSNWQATLWHEFCHVVTLQKTNNKMPRWLSEGISVYEERCENATWGQSFTPDFRTMTLGDDLTPVSKLSEAFLHPKTPQHLQFAYFQSALVVEYLVQQYGFDTLKRILVDLGVGMPINESLERYTGSIKELDEKFSQYAQQRATAWAPEADWSELPPHLLGAERSPAPARGRRLSRRGSPDAPDDPGDPADGSPSIRDADGAETGEVASDDPAATEPSITLVDKSKSDEAAEIREASVSMTLQQWNRAHPNSFWGLRLAVARLLDQQKWQEAKEPLLRLIRICPDSIGEDSAYSLLARAHRELGETEEERAVLAKLAVLDASSLSTYRRLLDLCRQQRDWPAMVRYVDQTLAVDPLHPEPYRHLAEACTQLGDHARAIEASRALLHFNPIDPSELHFRLAGMYVRTGDLTLARRHVLMCLEETPRYRDALKLLAEIRRLREDHNASANATSNSATEDTDT
jgi:tetratricopeptide (TPR) repeat protein